MNGLVDLKGRALLTVLVGGSAIEADTRVEVWVDTAFTGELVLPKATIQFLGLEPSLVIDAVLGDVNSRKWTPSLAGSTGLVSRKKSRSSRARSTRLCWASC